MEQLRKISIIADEANDKDVIDFLGMNYSIDKILSPKDALEQSVVEKGGYSARNPIDVDLVILNDNPEYLTPFTNLYRLLKGSHQRCPIFIAFGEAATTLGALNSSRILQGINGHKQTEHLTTFCMDDERLIDFNVSSNHSSLLLPSQRNNHEILAFSTYNRSNSYTDTATGRTFKACRNFVEIEAIHFPLSKSFCFMYDAPKKGENVLIDITSQFLKR